MSSEERVFPHIIGGSRLGLDLSAGPSFHRKNPADGRQTIGGFLIGIPQGARVAVDAAVQAFSAWSRMTLPERGRILRRFGALLREHADELARIMMLEAGKTLLGAKGEMTKTIYVVDYYDGAGLRPCGEVVPSESRTVFTYTIRRPLGVVVIITPWNFPAAVPVWKLVPALLAGNCVVWKPSPLTPWISVRIVDLLEEAGVPKGVVNLVHGGEEVGSALVSHPRVQAVSFTGSTTVGRAIYRLAAERALSRVVCEMGGKNPAVVMEDADLDLAAAGIVDGAFGSAGQRCTATSRVIAHADIVEPLTERVVARANALKVGPGSDPTSQMGPLSSREHLHRVLGMVMDAVHTDGLKLLCGSDQPLSDGDLVHGCFMRPAVFGDVPIAARLFNEEAFGPVLTVTKVSDFDEAMAVAGAVDYGLSAALYTSDPRRIRAFVEQMPAGMLHVNEGTPGGEAQLPFGGIKATGIGPREMGEEGLRFFQTESTVFENWTSAGQSAAQPISR